MHFNFIAEYDKKRFEISLRYYEEAVYFGTCR